MNNWDLFQAELDKYAEVCASISIFLASYERECVSLIEEIKNCSFEECQHIFDQLYEIQVNLSAMIYKYGFTPNDKLQNFIYFFDRDDYYSRKYWYERFCKGLSWPD